MNKFFTTILFILSFVICSNAQIVKIIPNTDKERVDVQIDGQLFTSYRYEKRIKRPVLLPIMTANGNFMTRGFPIETRNGEDIGHPHQVGLSFSHGDINGIDFWNNSDYRTAPEQAKMGQIIHRKILKTSGGKGHGELVTQSDWIMPNGKTILIETTKYIFYAKDKTRLIDRETTLTAIDESAVFGDNKEGVFAIHLTRELQQPSETAEKITDEKGNISETTDNKNVTGEYLNNEGLKGDKIFGTLGKWAAVSGKIGDESVTVAIFDSPKNLNFPSYMMVRGYGLLALNPFGKKIFDPKSGERKFILEPKKSMIFRHRLLIFSEKAMAEMIEKEYKKFR
jgi:Methane oxygenase PmoA